MTYPTQSPTSENDQITGFKAKALPTSPVTYKWARNEASEQNNADATNIVYSKGAVITFTETSAGQTHFIDQPPILGSVSEAGVYLRLINTTVEPLRVTTTGTINTAEDDSLTCIPPLDSVLIVSTDVDTWMLMDGCPPEEVNNYAFTPIDGYVLTTTRMELTWNQYPGELYTVQVGTSLDEDDVLMASPVSDINSIVVDPVPSNGSILYLRLLIDDGTGVLRYARRTVQTLDLTVGSVAELANIQPPENTVLTGSTFTVSWNQQSGFEYGLRFGDEEGSNNLYGSGALVEVSSIEADTLPTDGRGEIWAQITIREVATDEITRIHRKYITANITENTNLTQPQKIRAAIVGTGRFTTGAPLDAGGLPLNPYTVTNTNDSGSGSLREGMETNGSYITFHPSIWNSNIDISTVINPILNITVDAIGTGISLRPKANLSDKIILIRTREVSGTVPDNIIIAGLKLDGRNEPLKHNGLTLAHGQNFALLGMTTTGFSGDDSINIGDNNNPEISAMNVSIGYYKTDSSKGLLNDGDHNLLHEENRVGLVTVYNSWFKAKDRNPRNSGAFTHVFNCLIEKWTYGSNVVTNQGFKKGGPGSNVIAETLSESCVAMNPPTTSGQKSYAFRADNTGDTHTPRIDPAELHYTRDILYGSGVNSGENERVIDLDQYPNVEPQNIEINYPYTLLGSENVETYVRSIAGAENFTV